MSTVVCLAVNKSSEWIMKAVEKLGYEIAETNAVFVKKIENGFGDVRYKKVDNGNVSCWTIHNRKKELSLIFDDRTGKIYMGGNCWEVLMRQVKREFDDCEMLVRRLTPMGLMGVMRILAGDYVDGEFLIAVWYNGRVDIERFLVDEKTGKCKSVLLEVEIALDN
jgi:hypothetical protein